MVRRRPRLLVCVIGSLLLPLVGCDSARFNEAMGFPSGTQLDAAPMPGEMRFGTVQYELLSSDCSDETAAMWQKPGQGFAIVENGTLSMHFDTVAPGLEGLVADGGALIDGNAVVAGEDGEPTVCAVTGSAQLGDDSIRGELTEVLSVGGNSCSSRARYVLEFAR